jgi:hypothetical protein
LSAFPEADAQNAHFPRKKRFYVTDNKHWPVDQWWG